MEIQTYFDVATSSLLGNMYVVYAVGISYRITNHITGVFTVRLHAIIFY